MSLQFMAEVRRAEHPFRHPRRGQEQLTPPLCCRALAPHSRAAASCLGPSSGNGAGLEMLVPKRSCIMEEDVCEGERAPQACFSP